MIFLRFFRVLNEKRDRFSEILELVCPQKLDSDRVIVLFLDCFSKLEIPENRETLAIRKGKDHILPGGKKINMEVYWTYPGLISQVKVQKSVQIGHTNTLQLIQTSCIHFILHYSP